MKRVHSIILALALIVLAMASAASAATVTANMAGNGMGIFNISPNATISCTGSACTVTFTGDTAALTASANPGSRFTGWVGCQSVAGVNNAECTVTSTNAPVTATFTATTPATVTAVIAGTRNGTLSAYPGSNWTISGPVANVYTVTWDDTYPNTNAYIKANQNTVYDGVIWTGCDSIWSTDPTVCVVSRATVSPVTATYVILPKATMVANMAGPGKGTLSVSANASISCAGSSCTINWPAPQPASITATANPGDVFQSWSGCDSTSGPGGSICAISGTTVSPVTATFIISPAKIGVFRNGIWYLDYNGDGVWNDQASGIPVFGQAGDIPVVGDWTGTKTEKIGVFRKGVWYLDTNGNNVWDAGSDATVGYGLAGDIPVVGDWSGSGTVKIGVFRNGNWYLDYPGTGAWVGCGAPANITMDECLTFGAPGDIPVVGDWTGSGTTKIGVFRNGTWYLDVDGNGVFDLADATRVFGAAGDIPVVGDWTGSGTTKIGVFRPSTSAWYLDLPGTGGFVGCGAPGDMTKDACYTFGISTDIPVAGAW